MTTTVYYPEIVYYMQVDLFAIILLCFLLYTFRRGRARHVLSDENLFIGMLFVNLALLTLDCASTLLDGHTGAAAAAWNRAIACAFYALSPMMSYFYVLYCEIKLGVSPDTFARRMRTYLMPVLLNLVLSISSLFAPVIFWIDNNNRYQRGELFPFSMVLSLLLVVMAMLEICYVMLQKKASQRRLCLPLLLFPLPPQKTPETAVPASRTALSLRSRHSGLPSKPSQAPSKAQSGRQGCLRAGAVTAISSGRPAAAQMLISRGIE